MDKILNTIDNIAEAVRHISIKKDKDITDIENIDDIVTGIGGNIEDDDTILRSCIIKKDNSFIIKVSPKLSQKQKRFWVAFELGNLFINMGYKINEDKFGKYKNNEIYHNDTEYGYDIALLFATAFLTPKKLFIKKMKENYKGDGVYDIKQVSEYFKVEENIIASRGKSLGLLAKEDKGIVISKRG